VIAWKSLCSAIVVGLVFLVVTFKATLGQLSSWVLPSGGLCKLIVVFASLPSSVSPVSLVWQCHVMLLWKQRNKEKKATNEAQGRPTDAFMERSGNTNAAMVHHPPSHLIQADWDEVCQEPYEASFWISFRPSGKS